MREVGDAMEQARLAVRLAEGDRIATNRAIAWARQRLARPEPPFPLKGWPRSHEDRILMDQYTDVLAGYQRDEETVERLLAKVAEIDEKLVALRARVRRLSARYSEFDIRDQLDRVFGR